MDHPVIKQEYRELAYKNIEQNGFIESYSVSENSSYDENIRLQPINNIITISMEQQTKEENLSDSIELPCEKIESSNFVSSYFDVENLSNNENIPTPSISTNIKSNRLVTENSLHNEEIPLQPFTNIINRTPFRIERSINKQTFSDKVELACTELTESNELNSSCFVSKSSSQNMADKIFSTSRMMQSKSFFVNNDNYTAKENRGDSMCSLKRKLSIPDNLLQVNRTFENADSHPKRFKRTPFKLIQRNELEVAKFLAEMPLHCNNNGLDSRFNKQDSGPLQMTCVTDLESSVENLSPIKELQSVSFKHTNPLAMPNIVNNNVMNDAGSIYTENYVTIPQFSSSTPFKNYINYSQNLNDDESELFTICAESKINVLPNNSSNPTIFSNQYDENNNNEAQMSDNKTQQVFYSDDEIENINPAKKPKIKVKLGFSKNPQTSSSATSMTTEQKKPVKRIKTPETEQINFVLDVMLDTFTEQEIREGIFADQNSHSKSKTRISFSQDRVDAVKNAISEQFTIHGEELEERWQLLRSKINSRVTKLPKLKKFKKKFNIQ